MNQTLCEPGVPAQEAPALRPELSVAIGSALSVLADATRTGPAAFSTSFGAEDMVVLDLIRTAALDIEIFTLDTGRLPEQTHALAREVEERYGRCFRTWHPDATALQALLASDGTDGFRDSVEQRKRCCAVRKVEPLRRALAGKSAWVTGLRASQSSERAGLRGRAYDAALKVEKFSPLHDWSEELVWAYLRGRSVPVNALHARGYPSIGCAPCTRPVTVGEDPRAGRWWWEQDGGKECGLHARPGPGARA